MQTRAPTISFATAQKLTGLKIWQPAHLPSPTWQLEYVRPYTVTWSQTPQVVSILLKYRESATRWLVIEQRPLPSSSVEETYLKMVIPYEMWEGEIGNHPAAFFNHSVKALDEPDGQLRVLHGLWEHEGFVMEIQAPRLSQEELVLIGESLV